MRVVGGEIRKPQEMAGEAESWELCTCSLLLGDNFVLLYFCTCTAEGAVSSVRRRRETAGHAGTKGNIEPCTQVIQWSQLLLDHLTKGPSRAIHCNGTWPGGLLCPMHCTVTLPIAQGALALLKNEDCAVHINCSKRTILVSPEKFTPFALSISNPTLFTAWILHKCFSLTIVQFA